MRSSCRANCPNSRVDRSRPSISGSIRQSPRWQLSSPIPKQHKRTPSTCHTHSPPTTPSPSSASAVGFPAMSSVRRNTGISCSTTATVSAPSPRDDGHSSTTAATRRPTLCGAPRGGAATCPRSTPSTPSTSTSHPARPTRWTRSSVCCSRSPRRRSTTPASLPARCVTRRPVFSRVRVPVNTVRWRRAT
ncbi:Uncharacterised protein [Mycobacteroides abscessus subsp. abscessus]|nr:Uncharacterised protein [Mycobacteroides abscessus subsp. abscessus]